MYIRKLALGGFFSKILKLFFNLSQSEPVTLLSLVIYTSSIFKTSTARCVSLEEVLFEHFFSHIDNEKKRE